MIKIMTTSLSTIAPPAAPPPGSAVAPPVPGLFRGLAPAALEAVKAAGHPLRCARGQRLFHQGAAATRLYLLLQGSVRLTQLMGGGQLILLRLIVPGEPFGGVAALAQRSYPVSAEVTEPSVVLAWSGTSMQGLLRQHPQLAINLIDLMAQRLHDMQRRYEELATQQVRQRLARTLLRLAGRTGWRTADGGILIDVRLSRQDLAEMAGTSLFTASRTLRRWQSDEIIQSQRQRILIRRPHVLAAIAEDLDPAPPSP